MAGDLPEPSRKTPETPRTDGRRARADRTRASILTAAASLFIDTGYSSTSMSAIAARAGVSEQSVYYSFGTKREILARALDTAAAGDDADVRIADRPWVKHALAAASAVDQLTRQVSGAAAILSRTAGLLDVVRGAVRTEPEIAELWNTSLAQRRLTQLVFSRALDRRGALHPDLTASRAADIALSATSPESYLLLTRERGMSVAEWERWTTRMLAGALLA
ncbi:TetR/AcrR family transcriptional regulator [Plantibacter sp. YIM 135249]|uniref:TetR/AcrR family transcriptional regulator n=1 Tax=Plantibacter sp. YIM 135249 TaxID=3423918 RepID=UPI003D350FCE